jgi:predicted RNA-binding Zn ribbon-like protein
MARAALSTTMPVSTYSGMADTRRPNGRLVPAPGEELCVAFANTRYWRGSEPPAEKLNGLGDVLAWCERAGSIDARTVKELAAWAGRHGGEAARLFDETIAARETTYALLGAATAGDAGAGRDVDALNRLLAAAPVRATLAVGKNGSLWQLPTAMPAAASLLAPVLWSAGDLLAGQRLRQLRMCANDKCRWLFIDDSKSGTRRWCAMSSCGNRAKAHRHYLKKTGAAEAAD